MDEQNGSEFAVPLKRPWMAEIGLPNPITTEFASLIPSQRMTVGLLMSSGTILSYTLTADRTKLWVVLAGTSEAEVREALKKFPILPYCRYTIHELFFHEMAQSGIPKMSLN